MCVRMYGVVVGLDRSEKRECARRAEINALRATMELNHGSPNAVADDFCELREADELRGGALPAVPGGQRNSDHKASGGPETSI